MMASPRNSADCSAESTQSHSSSQCAELTTQENTVVHYLSPKKNLPDTVTTNDLPGSPWVPSRAGAPEPDEAAVVCEGLPREVAESRGSR